MRETEDSPASSPQRGSKRPLRKPRHQDRGSLTLSSTPPVDSEVAKLRALKDRQPYWNVVENLSETPEHVRGLVLIREDLRENPPHVIGDLLSVDQAARPALRIMIW